MKICVLLLVSFPVCWQRYFRRFLYMFPEYAMHLGATTLFFLIVLFFLFINLQDIKLAAHIYLPHMCVCLYICICNIVPLYRCTFSYLTGPLLIKIHLLFYYCKYIYYLCHFAYVYIL